jgi:hypothetical protein
LRAPGAPNKIARFNGRTTVVFAAWIYINLQLGDRLVPGLTDNLPSRSIGALRADIAD